MIDEYIKKGKISYFKNISKKGKVSRDMFRIEYNQKTFYLLCTFEGLKITHQMLICWINLFFIIQFMKIIVLYGNLW